MSHVLLVVFKRMLEMPEALQVAGIRTLAQAGRQSHWQMDSNGSTNSPFFSQVVHVQVDPDPHSLPEKRPEAAPGAFPALTMRWAFGLACLTLSLVLKGCRVTENIEAGSMHSPSHLQMACELWSTPVSSVVHWGLDTGDSRDFKHKKQIASSFSSAQ